MQDRFKFRGLAKNNEWCYGSLLWYAGEPQIWEQDGKNYIVKPETVGQCTGLKDKNGKLIYEGDIVSYSCLPGYLDIYACTFNHGSFLIGGLLISNTHLKSEVIGNIYKNPELLEVENSR